MHFDAKVSGGPRNVKREGFETIKSVGAPEMGNIPKTAGEVTVLASTGVENCDQQITIDCLRALYNIDYKPVATKKNSFGIGEQLVVESFVISMSHLQVLILVEYTPQAIILNDLDVFFNQFSPSQVGQRPKFVSIDGG